MTIDNRLNEPTEAMILAGLNAYSSKGLENDGYETTEEYPSLEMWGDRFASQMRAALVAAQDAAPQASEGMLREFSDYEDTLHQAIGDLLGNLGHELNSFGETRDFVADLFDLAAPASSSGVNEDAAISQRVRSVVNPSTGSHAVYPYREPRIDEEALAEVIETHREVYLPKQGDSGCSCGWRRTLGDSDLAAHRARAVAEWLKGQW